MAEPRISDNRALKVVPISSGETRYVSNDCCLKMTGIRDGSVYEKTLASVEYRILTADEPNFGNGEEHKPTRVRRQQMIRVSKP